MKNACPKCGTAYNVNASVIGRKFTCKNCGTPVVVTEEGLDYQNAAPKAPPPSAPAAPASSVGGAFDFDAGGEEELRPSRAAKAPKPPKGRSRDDDEEDARDVKKKRKYEDDAEDDVPARKPKRTGNEKNVVKDFLFFKEFVAPAFVKVIFILAALIIIGSGLIAVLYGLISGKVEIILAGLGYLVIGVPFYLLLARIYCELILLGFAIYDRMGEVKALLEKNNPPVPPAPPVP